MKFKTVDSIISVMFVLQLVELVIVSCHVIYAHSIIINQTLLFNTVMNFKLGTATSQQNNRCSKELLNKATR